MALSTEFVEVSLSCASWQEAYTIADALLEKHLVACAEFLPIQSKYWWKQSVERAEEVKLVMQSKSIYFRDISAIVDNLHSYEAPALHATPIAIISAHAEAWLADATKKPTSRRK